MARSHRSMYARHAPAAKTTHDRAGTCRADRGGSLAGRRRTAQPRTPVEPVRQGRTAEGRPARHVAAKRWPRSTPRPKAAPSNWRKVASGFRLQVREELAPWVGRLFEQRPPRYSRALLETLALIVYRQPVTRGDIEEVRGVSVSQSIMRTLLDHGWIRAVGQRDTPGPTHHVRHHACVPRLL